MAKKKRIQRSKEDLKLELCDQISLLQHACERYDSGLEAIGKHIALSLRVLLYHHGQSRALLEQLGLRNAKYYDSAGPINPKNLLSECNLIILHASATGGRYIPQVTAGGGPFPPKKVTLERWWNEPVLKDQQGRMFNRCELILNVADTDGGAHVDPELEEVYMDLSRNNSLGWVFGNGNIEKAFEGRAELACMRQIAHELLMTLRDVFPDMFRSYPTSDSIQNAAP